ncbi:MAG: hypothetical protein ACWIPI_08205, partial [Polaribacter sp.]
NGQKFTKQIKYVMYDSKIDRKKTTNDKIYFYIRGETFLFLRNKSKLDTCNIRSLKKIEIEKVRDLSNKEYLFYKQKVKKIKNWKEKMLGPIPITRNHKYFRVFVIEKYKKNKIIKYEVDWDYSGIRGLKVNTN